MPLNLQQATTHPCLYWRLLDIPRQVWVSLSCSYCSFLLGPGAHKVLSVPCKRPFPQTCVSSGSSMVGLVVTSCHTEVCCTQSPCPCSRPLLTHTSTGDAQTQFCLSLCGVPGSWCTQFVWALWVSPAGLGFDSTHEFAPPTILLGLLFCPWIWGISSQLF